MYGIETIQSLNAKNHEAARILASHALNHEPATPTTDQVREHLAQARETAAKILNGAKG